MSRTLLNWGIFLIVLGAIPLAVQGGLLDAAVARELVRLWPLILIGIGVGLLLRLTPAAALGGVIVAATLGMLAGGVIATGIGGVSGACVGTGSGGDVTLQNGTLEGGEATISMELTCVGLAVDRQPGSGWSVEAAHAAGRPPVVEAGAANLRLETGDDGFFGPLSEGGRRDWRVTLPTDSVLSTSVTLNASNAGIDLGGGPLEAVTLTVNASDVRLDAAAATEMRSLGMTWNASSGRVLLPAASLSGNMTLNAASVTVCLPPEVGLSISHRQTLSSDNLEETGLVRTGDAWQSADYASATERIDLRISSNVSSFELSRDGGCQ